MIKFIESVTGTSPEVGASRKAIQDETQKIIAAAIGDKLAAFREKLVESNDRAGLTAGVLDAFVDLYTEQNEQNVQANEQNEQGQKKDNDNGRNQETASGRGEGHVGETRTHDVGPTGDKPATSSAAVNRNLDAAAAEDAAFPVPPTPEVVAETLAALSRQVQERFGGTVTINRDGRSNPQGWAEAQAVGRALGFEVVMVNRLPEGVHGAQLGEVLFVSTASDRPVLATVGHEIFEAMARGARIGGQGD